MRTNQTNISSFSFNETGHLEGQMVGNGTLSLVFSVTLSVMLALVVFSLGCTVEVRKLWSHIRRPWGIGVGLVCQFGLMPLTAYILAISFSVTPVQAIAILIMGCCPGGAISNIITYWVDGDMDLSLSMTTCSTVFAMGMMPFCLFIYSRSWELANNINIPYYTIGITLLSLVAPVGFGVFINYKWPKKAKLIAKIGSIIGILLIIVIGTASSVLYKGSWNTDLSILAIGIIYPLIGYISGFGIAVLVRQPWKRCRTIALETGAQNVHMCSTVLQLSFTPQQLIQMFTFPLIYGSFQLLNGLLLVAGYQLYKRRFMLICEEKILDRSKMCHNTVHGEINANFEHEEASAHSGMDSTPKASQLAQHHGP
ncbi:sodium-dependent organic anion transporter [Microcaecilia unicolor]|uniref:Solute carrier family 10 member 6 n=1 Tax=Microcaecilia unicolor TaxID=1415580 RepID=A0A6P7WTH4_9AMPH|nr:solute carrier family 10 member 6 [Microcaecilia unicolor]